MNFFQNVWLLGFEALHGEVSMYIQFTVHTCVDMSTLLCRFGLENLFCYYYIQSPDDNQ